VGFNLRTFKLYGLVFFSKKSEVFFMSGSDGSHRIWKLSSFFFGYAVAFGFLLLTKMLGMDMSLFFYGLVISVLFLIYLFNFAGIGIKFDLFVHAKKELLIMTYVMTTIGGMLSFLLINTFIKKDIHGLAYTEVGVFLLIISLGLLYFSKGTLVKKVGDKRVFFSSDDLIRKKAGDFEGILVQERMYDDVHLHLEDVFKYRVKEIITPAKWKRNKFLPMFDKIIEPEKKSKLIFAKDVDNEVVDIFQNIKPEILAEIKDFLLLDEKVRPFREYWVTFLSVEDDKEILDYMDFLSVPIKSGDENNKFYRYIYQKCRSKLAEVKKEYDFIAGVKRYKGVAEYAMVDMYLYAYEIKNIPMGNILAYAKENSQSRHFYGVFNSISIRSIGRYGIGFYAGYFLAKEHLEREGVI
jgi:hypothetical protein